MEKVNKSTYHDEVNKKNIVHLRELLDTPDRYPFAVNTFEGCRNTYQAGPESLMRTISGCFLSIFMTTILFLRKHRSRNTDLKSLI